MLEMRAAAQSAVENIFNICFFIFWRERIRRTTVISSEAFFYRGRGSRLSPQAGGETNGMNKWN
jgi:hypothetical protein